MDLCSQSCLAGRPPAIVCPSVCLSCIAKTLWLNLTFQPDSFMPAMCISTIDLYHFITVSGLPWLGIMTSAESNTNWLNFLTHFSVDEDESWCSAETIEVEYVGTNLREMCLRKGNNCCFLFFFFSSHFFKSYIRMHLDVLEPICFKVGVMIDTTKHCI